MIRNHTTRPALARQPFVRRSRPFLVGSPAPRGRVGRARKRLCSNRCCRGTSCAIAGKRGVRIGDATWPRVPSRRAARACRRAAARLTRSGLRLDSRFLPRRARCVRLVSGTLGSSATRASRVGAGALGARSAWLVAACQTSSSASDSNSPTPLRAVPIHRLVGRSHRRTTCEPGWSGMPIIVWLTSISSRGVSSTDARHHL